jgi:hypothetical protein
MTYSVHSSKTKKIIVPFIFLIMLIALQNASAGPPFLTDDPVPVDYQHWELYFFSMLDSSANITNIQAPAIELNYGVIPNLQLHMIIPATASIPSSNAANTYGLGDTEVGFKYRFIQETDNRPQIAIFPLFELPTGDASRGLGNGRLWMKLPIWLQKSWGSWTSYGGGGYALNSASGMKNYPYSGWLIQHDLNQHLTLGMELFSQGKSAVDTPGFTAINAGGYYNFTKNFSLLFTMGHNIAGQQNTLGYLGLYWTGGI